MAISNRIRFIPVGDIDDDFLDALHHALRGLQDYYVFDTCPEHLPPGVLPDGNGEYDEDQLDRMLASEAKRRYPGEYPVSICDLPLKGGLTSSADADSALVSAFRWPRDFPDIAAERIAAFYLADILTTRKVDVPPHNRVKYQCPSDSCDTPEEHVSALARAEYCPDCSVALRRSVNAGHLAVRELAAVFRILDWVAGRKRAFVIMPFGGAFDLIYKDHIRAVLVEAGWEPVRIDERTEVSEITDLIKEELFRARVVVADLSARNPNVYYELGFAHALELPGVLLIQNMAEVSFDLRQWRIITQVD